MPTCVLAIHLYLAPISQFTQRSGRRAPRFLLHLSTTWSHPGTPPSWTHITLSPSQRPTSYCHPPGGEGFHGWTWKVTTILTKAFCNAAPLLWEMSLRVGAWFWSFHAAMAWFRCFLNVNCYPLFNYRRHYDKSYKFLYLPLRAKMPPYSSPVSPYIMKAFIPLISLPIGQLFLYFK